MAELSDCLAKPMQADEVTREQATLIVCTFINVTVCGGGEQNGVGGVSPRPAPLIFLGLIEKGEEKIHVIHNASKGEVFVNV